MVKPTHTTRELLKPFGRMTIGEFIPVMKAAVAGTNMNINRLSTIRMAARYAAHSVKNN